MTDRERLAHIEGILSSTEEILKWYEARIERLESAFEVFAEFWASLGPETAFRDVQAAFLRLAAVATKVQDDAHATRADRAHRDLQRRLRDSTSDAAALELLRQLQAGNPKRTP